MYVQLLRQGKARQLHFYVHIIKHFLIIYCCQFPLHASMRPKRTSRRLRGYPPEAQERVEGESADEEASPPPGSTRIDCMPIKS